MNEGNVPDRQHKKARAFFLLGWICLFVMALMWSVDGSLVAMAMGAAVVCFLLGFTSRPGAAAQPRRERPGYSKPNDYTPGTFLSVLFGRLRQGQQTTRPIDPQRQKRGAVVMMFAVFVFTIILVVVLSSLFSDDDASMGYGYFQLAETQYYNQQYDSARINYRRAWQADPKIADAYLGYGKALAMQDQSDSAIMLFDQAVAVDPDLKEAVYYKAQALSNQKKYDDAIAILNQLTTQYPDYDDARLLLGDAYYVQKRYDQALPYYETVYANPDSRSHILCYIMAYIYDTKGNTQKAIPLYQEALQRDSSVVDIYQRLGELMPGDDGNVYRAKAAQLSQNH